MSTKVRWNKAKKRLVHRHIWGVAQAASPYIAYAILGDNIVGLTDEFLAVKRGQGVGEVDIGERRVIIRVTEQLRFFLSLVKLDTG